MKILIRILVNALAMWIAVYLVPGISLGGGIWGLLLVAVIFGLVNALIRPIVLLFSLPVTLITLGLFTLVINTAMLLLTAFLAGDYLDFTAENTFLTACLAAIVISLVSMVMSWILPDKKKG